MRQEGVLRHLLIRKAAKTKEIMVALVTTTQQHLDLTNWKEKLLKLPLQGTITGILHIWNDRLADVVQSDRTEILYGRDYIEEELLGLRFQITPFSFFQTNSLVQRYFIKPFVTILEKQTSELCSISIAEQVPLHRF